MCDDMSRVCRYCRERGFTDNKNAMGLQQPAVHDRVNGGEPSDGPMGLYVEKRGVGFCTKTGLKKSQPSDEMPETRSKSPVMSHSPLAYEPVVGKTRHSFFFGAVHTSTVERVKQHTPPRIGCATNPYPEVDLALKTKP